jgi:transposase
MLPAQVPIWVAVGPVDLRWSFDILIGVVRDRLGGEPRDGLYVFLNRRATRAKILFYDRTGWVLVYKRLDHGVFPLPETLETGAASVSISQRELELMLLGRDLAPARRRSPKKVEPTVH